MPTLDWLKKEFAYGYRSGDVLAPVPEDHRRSEELRCGAYGAWVFLPITRRVGIGQQRATPDHAQIGRGQPQPVAGGGNLGL